MTEPRVVSYDSAEALRADEARWDDLWLRSDVSAPTARAAHVALWLTQFAPDREFRAIAVMRGGRLLAALPLVSAARGGPLAAATLPSGDWSPGGELLCDSDTDRDAVLDRLAAATAGARWPLVWLEGIDAAAPAVAELLAAFDRSGSTHHWRPHYQVGRVAVDGNWDDARARWSRNHRRSMTRCQKRIAQEGDLALRRVEPRDPTSIRAALVEAFEIEDRSWKGAAGSSVLRTPGMLDFYRRQAELLAARGELALFLLTLDARPIAFHYGWMAKGVFTPLKIGYDASFAEFSPGQLMMMHVLEYWHADPQCRQVDFVGPLDRYTESWKPVPYVRGRLVVAGRTLLGKAMLGAYRFARPAYQTMARLRGARA